MKYAVIDVGSNSVRLMISVDGITQNKYVKTTRLAQNLGDEKVLKKEPIERTACAVSFFASKAKELCADKIYVFATAAVREAKNKCEFLTIVKNLCGLDVEVISGDMEAKLGAIGALNDKDGAIIDVGGASSEVMVVKNGNAVYSKSLDIGAVKIKDACEQNKQKILALVENKVSEYGEIPSSNFIGIGGTATTMAAISLQLEVYDPAKVHGYVLSIEQVKAIRDMLLELTLEQKYNLKGLQKERAEVISGGVSLIYQILKKAGADKITISESDNLEGYLTLKRS